MKRFKRICPNCAALIVIFKHRSQITRLKITKEEYFMPCPKCRKGVYFHIPENEILEWIESNKWYILISKKTEKCFMGYYLNTPLWTSDAQKAARYPAKTAEKFKRRLACQSKLVELVQLSHGRCWT